MVLELQAASKKVTDLETKIQKMEVQQTEKSHGELLFIMILYSIPKECCTYMNNECQLKLPLFWF